MQLEAYFDFLAPDDIRVRGTRVGIETILYDFIHRHRTPDEIVASYPSLNPEQVYATITYYLHHQDTISNYLAEWYERGQQMRAEQAHTPSSGLLRLRQMKVKRAAQTSASASEPASRP